MQEGLKVTLLFWLFFVFCCLLQVHPDILPYTEESARRNGVHTLSELEQLYNKEVCNQHYFSILFFLHFTCVTIMHICSWSVNVSYFSFSSWWWERPVWASDTPSSHVADLISASWMKLLRSASPSAWDLCSTPRDSSWLAITNNSHQ